MLSLFLVLSNSYAQGELPEPEITAFTQGWATIYDQDESLQADPAGYGDPEDDPGFKLRRVRFGIKGKNDFVKYSLSVGRSSPYDTILQVGNANLGLVDAFMGFQPTKGLWINVGTQKVPVSREQIMSSVNLVFTDRAIPSVWLVPNREVGLVTDYKTKSEGFKVRATAGVFNGNQSLNGDNNNGKMLAGRLELKLGNANVYKTYGKVDSPTFAVAGDFYHNTDLATNVMGYGADIIFRASGIAFLAEYRVQNLEPTNDDVAIPMVFSSTNRMGIITQMGYTLNRYEFAIRYFMFDDNTEASQKDAGDVSGLMAGLSWHGKDDGYMLGGGYQVRLESDPNAVLPNDTLRLWFQMNY